MSEEKLTEEEFIKEHTGLKGKGIVGDAYGSVDIHETQLDKQKVSSALRFWFDKSRTTVKTPEERIAKIKEELRLE